MNWRFDDDTPIYLQIIEQIKTSIAAGVLKPNDKLPSVRDLALEAGVNPNTMQKALAELEREGLVYSQRTAGRFVAEQSNSMSQLKEQLAQQHMTSYLENMKNIGYDSRQAVEALERFIK